MEFETHLYTQTTYSNVVYNFGIDHFEASFEALIKEATWFIWDKPPLPKCYARAEEFINDFIKRLTENEFIDFSRLWHDGCVKAIIEAQDVDRNHSAKV
jgi:hypothetical protein